MRILAGIASLVVLLALAGPALAATQRDREDCEKESGDKSIAACTRVIQDRSEGASARAAAYSNRGAEYQAKGEIDPAIADYNQAISLDPKNTIAYFNRGAAYEAKGNRDRAIADYRKALALNPNYEKARTALRGLGGTP